MSVDNTLAERGSRYGQFADHAKVAQGIQDVMRGHPNWDRTLDLDMKQALSVIADKIARILNGDPFYLDNWHDIQGYAKLIESRLQMLEADSSQELFEEKPKYPGGGFVQTKGVLRIGENGPEEFFYDRNTPLLNGGCRI